MKRTSEIRPSPRKGSPAAHKGIWLPAAFFLAVPLIEIVRSLAVHNYVERSFLVHGQMLKSLQWGCWILAAALALSAPFRKWLRRHLEEPAQAASPWRQWGPLAVCLEFTALLCFLTYCRYRGLQYPLDTAAIVQRAFNTLQGNWFRSSIFGCNAFSYHVAFTLDLFSPLLLIWRGSLPFLMLQCLALGSMGLAVYHLVYRLSSSAYAGFIGMLLVYSCPAYSQMCASRLDDSVFLAPFLLWALVFMEYERWFLFIAFLALAATTREHFPFSLAGLGIYAIFRRGKPTSLSSIQGAAIIAGAALLFVIEMKIIFLFPDALGYQRTSWDGYFHRYGFAGRDHLEFLAFLLRHPLTAFLKTVVPFDQSVPALSLVLYSALAPLAAPLQFIPFAIAVIPQLMTEPGPLHDMAFNYPSLVFGLLMFAAAHGIARVHRRLQDRSLAEFMLLPALLVCGFGFGNSKNPILPAWQLDSFDSLPPVRPLIPPNASLWTDEYIGTWTAARTQLKLASGYPGFDRETFVRELFKPEFVVLQMGFIFRSTDRSPILLYLLDNHYASVGHYPGFVILKAPDYPHPGGISPPTDLPTPTDEQLRAFNHFAVIRQHMLAGDHISPNSYKNLTAEQRRIEDFCAYLMGTDADVKPDSI